MTSSRAREPADIRMRVGIVLAAREDECTVAFAGEGARVAPYAQIFPHPRAGRVAPGHLVATGIASDGTEVIVWRWFDAVVMDHVGPAVTLWEPNHGTVIATPRDPADVFRPGSRAYLSAGLPGAEWWVAGPAVDRAESADVEVEAVRDFFTSQDLWGRLT